MGGADVQKLKYKIGQPTPKYNHAIVTPRLFTLARIFKQPYQRDS
jgi:hypothetical protein